MGELTSEKYISLKIQKAEQLSHNDYLQQPTL